MMSENLYNITDYDSYFNTISHVDETSMRRRFSSSFVYYLWYQKRPPTSLSLKCQDQSSSTVTTTFGAQLYEIYCWMPSVRYVHCLVLVNYHYCAWRAAICMIFLGLSDDSRQDNTRPIGRPSEERGCSHGRQLSWCILCPVGQLTIICDSFSMV